VDLYRYQFDDNSALRAAAYTITNHIIIAPGESIVFVESMGGSSFRRWWGPTKTNLQIIRYDAPNIGFSSLGPHCRRSVRRGDAGGDVRL
jgi:hypothetical protein